MRIVQLAAGRDRSAALTDSGHAWGWGAYRTWDADAPAVTELPLGGLCSSDPALVGHNRYAQPRPLPLNPGVPFALLADGHAQTLAVCRQGAAYAFKPIVDPRRGAMRQRLACQPHAIAQIASTATAGLVLDDKGTVWSWGPNTQGQLGRKVDAWQAEPGAITAGLPPISRLATGSAHVLALDTDGAVWAWGANAAGQLGNGSLKVGDQPAKVALPIAIQHIAAGDTHSLALDVEGRLWAWGANNHGQTGTADATYHTRPQRVPTDFPVAQLDGGMFHSVALSTQGEVYAWGWNGLGQAAHGESTSSRTPRRIPSLRHITLLAAGSGHVLASDGRDVFAWGDNRSAACGAPATQACIHTPATITLA